MTVDEVLTQHTAAEVRAANPSTVYDWEYEGEQLGKGFSVNEPVEFDVAYRAVTRIANGECPQHQI